MEVGQFDINTKHLRFKSQLSKKTLKLLKEQVLRMLRDQEKDQLFEAFMNWTPKRGEIMLYSDYCIHPFKLPTFFDSIMQTNKPQVRINTKVHVPFAVLNGWAAINEIAVGHRHVCLLQFEGHVPETIAGLPEVNINNYKQEYDIVLFNEAKTKDFSN